MAFGFQTLTTSGISQLSDSYRFYRAGTSGAYLPALSQNFSAIGGGLTYIYRPTGDFFTQGRQIFVNGAVGSILSPARVSGTPTRYSTDTYTSIGLENSGGTLNIVCADPLGWNTAGGYGLRVKGPDNSIVFSTSDNLFVVASVITVGLTNADLNITKTQTFDPAPFSGTPYLHFARMDGIIKINNTSGYLAGLDFWFNSNTSYSYRLKRLNTITYTGDFSARSTTLTITFTIGLIV